MAKLTNKWLFLALKNADFYFFAELYLFAADSIRYRKVQIAKMRPGKCERLILTTYSHFWNSKILINFQPPSPQNGHKVGHNGELKYCPV